MTKYKASVTFASDSFKDMFLNQFTVSSFSIPGTAVNVDISSTNDSAILSALEHIKQKNSLVIEKPESDATDAILAQANSGKWALFLNFDISMFMKADKVKKIVHVYSDNVLLTQSPQMHKIGKKTSWTISMTLGKPDIKHEYRIGDRWEDDPDEDWIK